MDRDRPSDGIGDMNRLGVCRNWRSMGRKTGKKERKRYIHTHTLT